MHNHLGDLHERYQIQAHWTRAIRDRIFERVPVPKDGRVLEVGSGTGVIIDEHSKRIDGSFFGLDIDPAVLHFSQSRHRHIHHAVGDGHHLPFRSRSFQITFCHFLLLWVHDPGAVLREMRRVTEENGLVVAFAEPDYGGRIDYPEALVELGELQERALIAQGCDTRLGRKLTALFNALGLAGVEVGVLGGQWGVPMQGTCHDREWPMLARDLLGTLSPAKLESYKQLDIDAWLEGRRTLYVPTFYAYGTVV